MITMMVLLCYVNLSGMSLECIVIVLMNNSLLGGQECTDYINIQQPRNVVIGQNRLAIIPRLNFTCNGRIARIRARMVFDNNKSNYPSFQVWRPASVGSTIYNKTGEVQLQSDDQLSEVNDTFRTATVNLIVNNMIEVQSGDIVGYYHPPDPRYRVLSRKTVGYRVYELSESYESVDLNNTLFNNSNFYRQPLIQFIIGKCAYT